MNTREAICLGIDPGLVATGFCALGERTLMLAADIRPQAQKGRDIERLCHLEDRARDEVREYRPCVVLIEEQRAVRGYGAVQEKVFAALCMGARRGFLDAEIEEPLFLMIAPSSFKKWVCGHGFAKTPVVVAEIRHKWDEETEGELSAACEDAVIAYGLAKLGLMVAGGYEAAPVRELR
jgi:Holliday junction resolvasome RuvABC endonuclease subunit